MGVVSVLNTRQIAARIRSGKLPAYSNGYVSCICHPTNGVGQTEALRFWSKGDMVGCSKTGKWAPALAVFPELNTTIDTRL